MAGCAPPARRKVGAAETPGGRSAACFRSGSASKTVSASLPPGKRQGRSSNTLRRPLHASAARRHSAGSTT
eukprot:6774418-Alexandrium_andersonii.AAC.1